MKDLGRMLSLLRTTPKLRQNATDELKRKYGEIKTLVEAAWGS